MASTEYERDKYLGRIHGKSQFTLVGDTLNAPNVNATSVTASSHVSASNYYGNNAYLVGVTTDTVQLNTGVSYRDPEVGEIIWDDANGTYALGLKGGNVFLPIGAKEVEIVRNVDSVDFTIGQIINVTGSSGQRVAVKRAIANSDINSATVLGMVTEAINQNQTGFVTISGLVTGVNTNSFNEGDVLWLSSTVSGSFTNVKPTAPNHGVMIGYVVKKNNNGSVYVHIQNGYEIGELHDVYTSGSANGDILQYVSANSRWENVASGSITVGTASYAVVATTTTGAAGGDLTGSYPNPTLAAVTTAGTSGSASVVPVVTIDAKGRVTTLSSANIAIAQSAVTNLTTDLSSRLALTGGIMTGQLNQQYGLNFDAIDDPNVAVGAVTITTSSGGSITAGLHYYYFTYYNSIGETKVNQTFPPFNVTIASPNQTVLLSNLPTSSDSRVIGRKIYRTTANVNRWQNARLIATIADNTTTTYTDTAADGGSGNAFYRENTTNNLMTMDGARALFVGGSNVASTFLGYNAGSNNFAGTSTGGENVLIGSTANMATGYDASKSVAIGNFSLAGESCVSIGHGAQSYSTSGAVIAIGRNTHSLCGGPGNIAIGNSSMAGGPSNHQANNNVCVGVSTGNKINAGWNNVLLGYNAGSANIVSNRSAIVIGANCDYPAGNAWAVMNIGNVLYGTNLYYSTFTVSSTPTTNGSIGICLPSPTARLHLPAGTTAASMAPLKFTSGSLLATAESGSVEFNGDKLYLTITSSTARKEFTLNDSSLTAGQQPTTTTNGRLTNSNKYSIYVTGSTNGTLGSSTNLTLASLPTSGDLRFFRITVKGKSASAPPDIFGRTLDAMWGNGMGTLSQVGSDSLGTLFFVGSLDDATIATTGSGTNVQVKCTDVNGVGSTVTWEVFGEYY